MVDIKFLGGAEAGFTELWSGTGKDPLRGKPMWEVGIVTGDSNTVQVPIDPLTCLACLFRDNLYSIDLTRTVICSIPRSRAW